MSVLRRFFYCMGVSVGFLSTAGHAENLKGALESLYQTNPQLNQARAGLRAEDEKVAQAKSGFRPNALLSATLGYSKFEGNPFNSGHTDQSTYPRSFGLTITQTLFDGMKTINATRGAESSVLMTREELRQTEMQLLYQGVSAYMDVLLNTANLNLKQNNVRVLAEQLRQTEIQFEVGEVTRTDVEQAKARLSRAKAGQSSAESELKTSVAVYRKLFGKDPKRLEPVKPVDLTWMHNVGEVASLAEKESPTVRAALHQADAADAKIRVQEAALYPQLTLTGGLMKAYDVNFPQTRNFTASVSGAVVVPLYERGLAYSAIREAKERAVQARIEIDTARRQARASAIDIWGQYVASKRIIQASIDQVRANEIALQGVREEAKVGQRMILDILNAQQELLDSRVMLINAQRDNIVLSYGVLQAVGKLSADMLRLTVPRYNPQKHLSAVEDLWFGIDLPDRLKE